MGYNKQNLGTGERMVLIAHKHIIVLIRAAIQWILLFVVALAAGIIINMQNWTDVLGTIKPYMLIVCLAAGVISLVAFGIAYLSWQAEQYIVTNERIIQIEGIINKHELTTSLEKINDIQTDQSLFGRILGYGTVDIITGSDAGINQLTYLEKPLEFKKVMLNAKNRYYGDASDFAPGGVRYGEDGEDRPQRRVEVGQGYAAPPASPAAGGPYPNDPRGYAPRPAQSQPQPQYGQPAQYGSQSPQYSQSQPNYAGQQPAPMTSQQIADSIQQLARLRDSGILTEAEFQAKKNELMNRL